MTTSLANATTEAETLHHHLLAAWNRRDASAMAAAFADDGSMVGFDGSQANGRTEIERHLAPIFADHPTAAFVAIVREVRTLADGWRVALFQNTPAAFHGRPKDAERLTAEVQSALERRGIER